jgi:hypothetical protein
MKSLRLLHCTHFQYIGLAAVRNGNSCLEELELTTCLPIHATFKIPMEVVGFFYETWRLLVIHFHT